MVRYFDIAWLSRLDGPGNRVVLFLQGCHLRCPWCHSPHSWEMKSALLLNRARCLHCNRCVEVCEHGVHLFTHGVHLLQREKCVGCGKCVTVCPTSRGGSKSGALALPTVEREVAAIFEELRPQLEVVRVCGGVTLSGGEALLQKEAVRGLLTLCKAHQIHTALETSLTLSTDSYAYVSDLVDCWLVGLRDPLLVGGKNADQLVRANVSYLASLQKQVIVRYPVIKGYTDTPEQLNRVTTMMRLGEFAEIEILPCNRDMDHYYNLCGIEPAVSVGEVLPNEIEIQNVVEWFQTAGFQVKVI